MRNTCAHMRTTAMLQCKNNQTAFCKYLLYHFIFHKLVEAKKRDGLKAFAFKSESSPRAVRY